MESTYTRTYRFQPDLHYLFHTGITHDSEQVIVSYYNEKSMVAVFFDLAGEHTRLETRPFDEDDDLIQWTEELGIQLQLIEVKKFFLSDYRIGIEDYPDERDVTDNPSVFSEEELGEILEHSADFKEMGNYVFWWNRDFWVNRDGEITDT